MRSTPSVTGFWYFDRVESGAGWLCYWGDRGVNITKFSTIISFEG